MRKAIYAIDIDGQDVSSAFAPLLLSMEIDLTDGGETDRLTIALDDTNGQIVLPRIGASVSAYLGWDDEGSIVAFQGFTDEPKSSGVTPEGAARGIGGDGNIDSLVSHGDRSSGRVLTITAHSADLTGDVKQPMQAHADSMSFGDVVQQWAQKAGLQAQVAGALGSIKRDYWAIANESFMQWGARTARELGATFKIIGSQAVFVPRSGGTSVSGQTLTSIPVTWGVNLLSWDIAPKLARPSFSQFGARFWDPVAAQWQEGTAQGGGGGGAGGTGPKHTERFKAPNQDQAQSQAGSNQDESKRDGGQADSVVIDGNPEAMPAASSTVSGIRAGVDGTYTIKDVKHRLARAGGFTTHLTYRQPDDGAGSDDRGSAPADGDKPAQ